MPGKMRYLWERWFLKMGQVNQIFQRLRFFQDLDLEARNLWVGFVACESILPPKTTWSAEKCKWFKQDYKYVKKKTFFQHRFKSKPPFSNIRYIQSIWAKNWKMNPPKKIRSALSKKSMKTKRGLGRKIRAKKKCLGR